MPRVVSKHVAKKRKLGAWKGKVRMSRDFDAPLPAELLAAFEGGRNNAPRHACADLGR